MCRNIRTLHHFDPPATPEEIRASAIQFVRKLSGVQKPSKVNEKAFERAVEKVMKATVELFDSLEVHGPPRDREEERRKAQERGLKRDQQLRARLLATS
ncbi:MAG: DUF2277 domain-containing protein [Archangium sp.]|nr:DUF2277 domain-containing protein [Archangium sp.]